MEPISRVLPIRATRVLIRVLRRLKCTIYLETLKDTVEFATRNGFPPRDRRTEYWGDRDV